MKSHHCPVQGQEANPWNVEEANILLVLCSLWLFLNPWNATKILIHYDGIVALQFLAISQSLEY